MSPQIALLRRVEVEERLKVSRSFIYSNVAKGNFPKPIQIGPRAYRWRVEDIDRWLEKQAQADLDGSYGYGR